MTTEHEEHIRDTLESVSVHFLLALILHKFRKTQMSITLEDIEDYMLQFPQHHLLIDVYPRQQIISLLVLNQEDVPLLLDPIERPPA